MSGKKGGASKSAKEKLVGTWTGKFEFHEEKAKELLTKQNVPEDKQKTAIASMKKMFGEMTTTMTLKKDGTSVSTSKVPDAAKPGKMVDKEDTGKWKVLKEEGDKATLEVTEKGPKGKEKTTKLRIVFTDADTFKFEELPEEMKMAPIKTVTFTRKK